MSLLPTCGFGGAFQTQTRLVGVLVSLANGTGISGLRHISTPECCPKASGHRWSRDRYFDHIADTISI